jgi:trans-aconitate methyltransferase
MTEQGDNQAYSFYHTTDNLEATRILMSVYISLYARCGTVLDIGCGPGTFLELLHAQNGAQTLIGVDNDQAMVNRSREKGFDARLCRVQELSVAVTEAVDGIYAGHIIEHLNGSEALDFVTVCFAKLNPGGILVLRTPNWSVPYVRDEGFWLDLSHIRPYPARLLDKMLVETGFVNVRTFAENSGLHDTVAIGVKGID